MISQLLFLLLLLSVPSLLYWDTTNAFASASPSFLISLSLFSSLTLACFAISQFRNSQARPQAQFLANFSAEFPNDLCAACFSWLHYRSPLSLLPSSNTVPFMYLLSNQFPINFASRLRSNNNLFPASRLHRNLFAQLCGSSTAQNWAAEMKTTTANCREKVGEKKKEERESVEREKWSREEQSK